MKWMDRMFLRLLDGNPPSLVDLPTGAGKTDVIVIWLIALAWYAQHRDTAKPIPRRLVWVVNRRVLVQHVHTMVKDLIGSFAAPAGLTAKLASHLRSLGQQDSATAFNVVQLRGQRLDDREWTLDPAMPQLIIGTVDQIGSRLLFQGYGLGKWSRPLHAALLGVDAWVCVDEAHLVPAFVVTLRQVREMACRPTSESVPQGIRSFFGQLPFWITELSATPGLPRPRYGQPFSLEPEDNFDEVIADRLLAKRTRRVIRKELSDKKHLVRYLATEALNLAKAKPGSSIAVFCSLVTTANAVAQTLKELHPGRVLSITGRIRGYERDLLAKEGGLFDRFRQPHPDSPASNAPSTFLVGTAAAEVGLDADASAIVCDFSSLPTLVQRLGRLDRRGQLSKRAESSGAQPPTMTIIGGSNGKTPFGQLNSLVAALNSACSDTEAEFHAKFFTGVPWCVVVGKEKTEKQGEEDQNEESEPKAPHALNAEDIIDFDSLRDKILESQDGISMWIRETVGDAIVQEIGEGESSEQLIQALNTLIGTGSFYDSTRFANVKLRDKTTKLKDKAPKGKNLRKLNRWLLEDAFPNEIATGAKFGKDDAIESATWRVMGLPTARQDEDDEDGEIDVTKDRNGSSETATYETRQSSTWLTDPLAAVTSGPVVVPPLTESVLQRWAATTPSPTRFLPVHPWLYGLLPDDEGTPLVGIAFRLELDVLRFHAEDTEDDEDNAAYDREWQRVRRCLKAFPPLNSELHFVPLNDARTWLESENAPEVRAHFDGDEWSEAFDPSDLSPKSVIVLPTSTDPDVLKGLIAQSGDELPDQRCWDVFDSLAEEGAKYRRNIKITAGTSRLKAGQSKGHTLVYRIPHADNESDQTPTVETNDEAPPTNHSNAAKWKPSGIKLGLSYQGIALELTYLKPDRSSGTGAVSLSSHLDAAADHARCLAEALAPSDSVLAALLSHSGKQHDFGKDYPKWQQAMGNTSNWRETEDKNEAFLTAKPVIDNPGEADGYRHEWGTLWALRDDTSLIIDGLDGPATAFLRDIHWHSIAAHHGYFRPSMPDRGFREKAALAKQSALRLEAIERASRLQRHLGPWRLAYLETLIKVADVLASQDAENVATEDTTDED
jgi:hypothetical protein